eukprot:CAMPEP_0204253688 /NCGR_PEP_ID=MMETSP0468-20130131/2031_1 /ASSEMBLY_ACC=CAM_ASM_000383 /TAXON_ID=2969 /ORGANISM="Oxyrrhis marina" /LENGTH=35 /DNA_ID= /DNA_START= /DNA_END= /DNA_ORIENTATION=
MTEEPLTDRRQLTEWEEQGGAPHLVLMGYVGPNLE